MRLPVSEWGKWYIASGFGEKRETYWHEGVDLNLKTGGDTDLGQPLLAIANGQVTSVHEHTTIPSFGKHLHIKFESPFGTRYAHYAHCQKILVPVDALVAEGQQVAELGKSGTKVAHCHFCIKKQPTGIDAVAKTEEDLAKWEDPIVFIEKCLALLEPQPDTELEIQKKINELAEKFTSLENSQNQNTNDLGAIIRRLDGMQNDITQIYKDRDLYEKIKNDVVGVEGQVNSLSTKLDSVITELKSEIRGLKETTGERIEDLLKRVGLLEEKPSQIPGVKILISLGKKLFIGKYV